MDNRRIHHKYASYLYGPDNLLKPLALIQQELARSCLDAETARKILALARQYWDEIMPPSEHR